MEPIQPVQSDDGAKFEYVVSKLLGEIVNPLPQEPREENERDKARLVYTLINMLGLREYKDEFIA